MILRSFLRYLLKYKKDLLRLSLVLFLVSAPSTLKAASLNVTPSASPADTSSGFTFYTQATEAGGEVEFQIYHDFNNNGLIDFDEWPLIDGLITDNGVNDTDDLMTWDNDPTEISITAVLNPFSGSSGYLPAGNFIARVKNSAAEMADVQFSITHVSSPQTVSGTVYKARTAIPLVNAVVACISLSGGCAALTDINGSYELQVPSTGNYDIKARKQSYEQAISYLNVPAGGVTNINLFLSPVITGIMTESDNSIKFHPKTEIGIREKYPPPSGLKG